MTAVINPKLNRKPCVYFHHVGCVTGFNLDPPDLKYITSTNELKLSNIEINVVSLFFN